MEAVYMMKTEDQMFERGNYIKVTFILWLITRVIGSPHAYHIAEDLRADASFRELLRAHEYLRGYFPDVCVESRNSERIRTPHVLA